MLFVLQFAELLPLVVFAAILSPALGAFAMYRAGRTTSRRK